MRLPLQRLPYCWRVSRYEPELRERETRWESWTDYSDIGAAFNGVVLSPEEYYRVEDTYIAAAVRFAVDASAVLLRVTYVGHHQAPDFALDPDQIVVRSDLGPIIRGNLRGNLDCALEATNGRLQVAFGYDLYMYIAADSQCESAVAGAARDGLWLEPDVPLALWDDDTDDVDDSS